MQIVAAVRGEMTTAALVALFGGTLSESTVKKQLKNALEIGDLVQHRHGSYAPKIEKMYEVDDP